MIQSISDIITNSSSEVFLISTNSPLEEIKEALKSVDDLGEPILIKEKLPYVLNGSHLSGDKLDRAQYILDNADQAFLTELLEVVLAAIPCTKVIDTFLTYTWPTFYQNDFDLVDGMPKWFSSIAYISSETKSIVFTLLSTRKDENVYKEDITDRSQLYIKDDIVELTLAFFDMYTGDKSWYDTSKIVEGCILVHNLYDSRIDKNQLDSALDKFNCKLEILDV